MLQVVLASTVICLAAAWAYASRNNRRRRRIVVAKAIIRHQMEDLNRRQAALFEMLQILNSHAGTHAHVLRKAGIDRLSVIRDELERAEKCCESLIVERHFRDACRLLRFLLSPNCQKPPKLKSPVKVDFRLLKCWENTANGIIIACVNRLNELSAIPKRLEARKPKLRRRTISTLEELRRVLAQ